jgi:hypothetical protein
MFSDSKIIIGLAAAAAVVIVVVIVVLLTSGGSKKQAQKKTGKNPPPKTKEELEASYEQMMQDDVYHIFSNEFHEELRNKARLDFQKVINENAMFLQQDLRLTTSEINEYLKKEVTGKLQEEFMAYQQSIKDVQQAAVKSINDTVLSAQQQQQALSEQIKKDSEVQKAKMLADFEANMGAIVSHYVVKTVGEHMDLKEQLPLILREMETQKEAMRQDMWL